MKRITWLILILVIASVMLFVVNTGITTSYFTDDEPSTDDTLLLFIPQVVLDDGFEGTPWDDNWNDNGTTTWLQDSAKSHTGTYNARISNADTPGYLTSDDIDAAGTTIIYVSFWFNLKGLEAGDCVLQRYNGSAWITWYDLLDYPTYTNNVWSQFNEEIIDSQYFVGNFRIRFDSSVLGDGPEEANIDDVLISTFDSTPLAPTGLVATLGDTEVSLDWNDNSEGDLDGYNVYRSLTSGSGYSKVNGSLVATSDYTDTGLTNDVTYYYIVTAVDFGSNESDYSNEDNATPTDLPPAAPTGLVATSGNEEISLDWNDNSEGDFDGYNVYRSTDSGGSPTPYTKINGSLVATSGYTDTELTYDVTYYYVVMAVDLTSNESSNSNEDSAIANNIAPAAPTGLAAAAGDKEIDLNWSDNSEGDFDGYNVYRSLTSGSGYSKINGSLVSLSNYNDTGLTNGVTYYYVVTAVDTYTAESGYSDEDSATPVNAPPSAPTGLVSTPDNAEVSLNWNDNSEGDLDGYNVYRSLTSGSGYSKINGSLVATSDYIDTGLTNNVTYYYVVTAVDTEAAESSDSNEASATPTAPVFLDDGFEVDPWDDNWNNNGTTTWIRDAGNPNNGTYNALISNSQTPGYLTSDDIDASVSTDITVNFWFNLKSLEAGDCVLQLYNGSAWTTWYDLLDYPTYVNNVWIQFSEMLSDPQYFISGFRIRFDASALGGTTEEANIDDVLIITDSIPPSAPTGLVATPGDTEVSLDWNDNSEGDLDGYNVYRSLTSGSGYSKINGSLAATSDYTDTGLANGITYYYVVTAVDLGNNESGYSNEASATPADAAPAAPTGLVATTGNEEISLNWNDNSEGDIDGYNVYRSLTSGSGYSKINGSLVATSDYTDTGLYGGGAYYYVVTAVDLADPTPYESGYSNEDSATANDSAPAAPTGLVATPGDRQASLDWNDNSESDINGYNVYRSLTSGSGYSKINGSLVATSDYTDTDLTGGVTYYYVVTAVDLGSNESGYSNEDSAIPTDSTPAAPTGLIATPGDRQASLDWDDNSEPDIDGYNVYRSEAMGGPYSKVNGSLAATSDYIDTGLIGGITYYYVVTAVDLGSNESGYSNEDSAIPTDAAPATPTGLTATSGEAEISLDWNDNAEDDLDGYNVYRSLTSGSGYSKINGSLVATSDYTDTDVTNGITYYYVVTAVDLGSNESGYSNEDNAIPTDAAPLAPTGLVATPGDRQASLNWNDNSEPDIDGYNVYRSLTSGSGYSKINGSLVAASDYTDTDLTGGVTYYYVVTAVDLADPTPYESGYSNEDSAIPFDTTPVAPTGLVATKGVGQVSLNWNDNTEPDLDGYNIYRSTDSGGSPTPYTKINGSLAATSDYIDNAVTNGITYYYVVTAVDLVSNESDYSNEDSARPVGPPQTLLNDGFEGAPWDTNWDGNGTTTWAQDSSKPNSGTYDANISNNSTPGYLTSDDLDTFAAENITVSFWFNTKNIEAGDCVLQIYNGSAWTIWYDLLDYPTYTNNTWSQFSEVITDSQYFISDFRIRFDSSVLGDSTEQANIDDVLIAINQ